MMWNAFDEILNSAIEQGISFVVMDEPWCRIFIDKIRQEHLLVNPNKSSRRLFEKLNDCSSCKIDEGLVLLKNFSSHEAINVFLEEYHSKILRFNSMDDILKILAKCPNFSVYMADNTCSYLIALTEEQTMVCNKSAADWLDGLTLQPPSPTVQPGANKDQGGRDLEN